MSAEQHPRTEGTAGIGPIWRDANVRSGPSLDSPVIRLLLPDEGTSYEAERWVTGDEVIEGTIVSDVWFRLTIGGWCSAVNFHQETVADVLATAPGQA
ncbi:hypothetical protein [Streptomyces spirodelae]|uniref:SH3 domain-containing protein n=1 Tax=Streptomyces spirodelae TaxID=2812904 RepID=A0ABS3WSK8_9ACTN|nr:hypothetical protein [Streptomyces spirodelae]MBO8185856.1 hypothetical protein [Streptomyces spirodelae]